MSAGLAGRPAARPVIKGREGSGLFALAGCRWPKLVGGEISLILPLSGGSLAASKLVQASGRAHLGPPAN